MKPRAAIGVLLSVAPLAVACSEEHSLAADPILAALADGSVTPLEGDSTCAPSSRAVLDAGADELAAALGSAGFATLERRMELVFAASCARDLECGKASSEAACLEGYRTRFQTWISPGTRHVPCIDAYLDALGCTAALSCCDADACKSLRAQVDPICDAPPPTVSGSPEACDPTLHSPPTKGRIPEAAIPPDGHGTDWSLVPDFVTVWSPASESIAGYVRKCVLASGETKNAPVYGEDLTTVVGHIVAPGGLVPL